MDPKRILREDVEFGFNFFLLLRRGVGNKSQFVKTFVLVISLVIWLICSYIYVATCYISTILLIQAFANYNGGLENIIKTFLLLYRFKLPILKEGVEIV